MRVHTYVVKRAARLIETWEYPDQRPFRRIIAAIKSTNKLIPVIIALIAGNELPRNVPINVPLKFLSILLVKGIEDLKINQWKYNYGSKEFDVSAKIMKKEQKLDLQLGPKFNYNKRHELFLSLHSESKFRIMLQFEVVKSLCKFDQPSIIVYPGRPSNDFESRDELNLKGIKFLTKRDVLLLATLR